MPLVEAGRLVVDAVREARAVAAFNVISLDHVEAVLAGAEAADAPVILQISENAVRHRHGRLLPLARAAGAAAEESGVPAALHLDHVRDTALLHRAADAGFSSVMYDAAHLPYAENVSATREAAAWAHRAGLWIEAELGQVGGKLGEPALDPHDPAARTDPDQALSYVAETGVDALAVAIGSSHAMTSRNARLDHDLLAKVAGAVACPLVLHGSSGVPDVELDAAVTGGIAKVNVGTALNTAFTAAVREELAADPKAADPRHWLAPGREAMTGVVSRLIPLVHRTARAPYGSPTTGRPAADHDDPRSPGVRHGVPRFADRYRDC